MNKTDLIRQLAERLDGDRNHARIAVEGFIDLVQREVQKGRNVSISGFGVFEKRSRASRSARNPRTGEAVKVKRTNVPAFRPGKYFKDVVAGTVKLPRAGGTPVPARTAAAAARAAMIAGAATTKPATRSAKSTAPTPAIGTASAPATGAATTARTARRASVQKTGTATTPAAPAPTRRGRGKSEVTTS
jgi:DNA-binding protein HU-beta